MLVCVLPIISLLWIWFLFFHRCSGFISRGFSHWSGRGWNTFAYQFSLSKESTTCYCFQSGISWICYYFSKCHSQNFKLNRNCFVLVDCFSNRKFSSSHHRFIGRKIKSVAQKQIDCNC